MNKAAQLLGLGRACHQGCIPAESRCRGSAAPCVCGIQREPSELGLCASALHPVVGKAEWRQLRAVGSQGVGRSGRWAGVSTDHPALTGLGSEKREGFLSFAKLSVTAVFSSCPNKLLP